MASAYVYPDRQSRKRPISPESVDDSYSTPQSSFRGFGSSRQWNRFDHSRRSSYSSAPSYRPVALESRPNPFSYRNLVYSPTLFQTVTASGGFEFKLRDGELAVISSDRAKCYMAVVQSWMGGNAHRAGFIHCKFLIIVILSRLPILAFVMELY